MWNVNDSCLAMVNDYWKARFVGCPTYILNKKVQLLKGKLRIWTREHFGDVHFNVRNNQEILKNIQDRIQIEGWSEDLSSKEKLALENLEKALTVEEIFWHEKSRSDWNLQGDRNTAYFHKLDKIKGSRNFITHLVVGDDTQLDPDDIS
ncbi:unnamed protein product [Vicia faba]|uniref:RNA-directed DNA polymerase (Reverse transcriptase) n=1 Tax=Vicia faba TaxID=3906 RepID=A0AAV0YRI5_VICFA|nr:unnamed protein product [Vicia faba]